MKSVSIYYNNFDELKKFIETNSLKDSPQMLIQIFTGRNDISYIEGMLKDLQYFFTQAAIIGSTTDGEMLAGVVSTGQTVISFTTFEYTTLNVSVVKDQSDDYLLGKVLAKNILQHDTKLLIAFADGIHTNGDDFLEGISSVDNTTMIAGGLAGDNANFLKTYVFTKNEILTKGAVAVSLNSTVLTVGNAHSFQWRGVGVEMKITKVEKNRIFTIDNRTAVDTYMHYLGQKMEERLPTIGLEFPLITVRDNTDVARVAILKHQDGSLSFSGNFKAGEKVKFGYTNVHIVLQPSQRIVQNVKASNPDAIFVYSCMARRRFMPNFIKEETIRMHEIAPVSGFFTYGEFFTSTKKQLLNQTMTLVYLNERVDEVNSIKKVLEEEDIGKNNASNALIHLLNVTSNEAMKQTILKETADTFKRLFEASPDGIAIIHRSRVVECNQKVLQMFGYEIQEEFIKMNLFNLTPRRQPDGKLSSRKIVMMVQEAIKKSMHKFEWLYKKKDGTLFWAEVMLSSFVLRGKSVIYLVARDISERKEMELELLQQKNALYYSANHDTLTSLPNRNYFTQELKKYLNEIRVSNSKLSLMFIDLDEFKKINDSLGHSIGDIVIIETAKRLVATVGEGGFVARLGGDEFLVILRHINNEEQISIKAQEILRNVKKPIRAKYELLYTSASIGISRYLIDDIESENLLKYADIAMYKAKEKGGDTYMYYESQMTEINKELIQKERDLKSSLAKKDFELYFQPQLDIHTKEIVGIEILTRWHHPIDGLVSPLEFISLLEKMNMIKEYDEWVIDKALGIVSRWRKEGLFSGIVSLNVSIQHLEQDDFLSVLCGTLKKHKFEYTWLEIEVTESELMKNTDKVIAVLESLHQDGITLAMDDFGTGYSSLSQLKNLPIDKLKIDKSFIFDVSHDNTAKEIVHTMIVLAKSLNISILAEGVEAVEQEEFLLRSGCNYVQGYYYSKPICERDMKNLLVSRA